MRLIFMAGAEHCFSSVLGMMDEGSEPTDKDMDRMTLLHNELEAVRPVIQQWAKAPGRPN